MFASHLVLRREIETFKPLEVKTMVERGVLTMATNGVGLLEKTK